MRLIGDSAHSADQEVLIADWLMYATPHPISGSMLIFTTRW
jgi:hypothetical protein